VKRQRGIVPSITCSTNRHFIQANRRFACYAKSTNLEIIMIPKTSLYIVTLASVPGEVIDSSIRLVA
jgi:hypothetical protein